MSLNLNPFHFFQPSRHLHTKKAARYKTYSEKSKLYAPEYRCLLEDQLYLQSQKLCPNSEAAWS